MSFPARLCISTAAVLLLGGIPTADAAFIRRGKIKQRGGIGYKVVVVTSGDTATDVDSLSFDTATLDRTVALDRSVTRVRGSADIEGFNDPNVTVTATIDVTYDVAFESASFDLAPCQTAPCAWSTATLSDGLSVKARIVGLEGDVNSQLETVVIARAGGAQDALADGASLQVAGSFGDASGLAPVELRVDDVRTRWKATVDTDPGTDSLTWQVAAYDAEGVFVDSMSQTDSLVAASTPEGIGKVKLKQRKNGSYRLTTLSSNTDGASEVVNTTVTTADGAVLAEASATSPDTIERRFVADGIEFIDPDAVVGGQYLLSIDPKAADGSLLDGSVEIVFIVEAGDTEVFIEDLDPTDGLEIGHMLWGYDADLGTWYADVAVTGEAAAEVATLDFLIDSQDANPAVEPDFQAPLAAQWNEYNLTFTSDVAISDSAPVQVDITVQDSTGASVDSAGATTGTGVVYKASGFGKGTRNTSTTASAKPELL
ncbi:MAG: hypothetical protein D6798_08490 [Deltaproteobacteria bacterium]|nr:MAG: hypothetical protein D6798_08490 [Deltaproteobacteria bacterium]